MLKSLLQLNATFPNVTFLLEKKQAFYKVAPQRVIFLDAKVEEDKKVHTFVSENCQKYIAILISLARSYPAGPGCYTFVTNGLYH